MTIKIINAAIKTEFKTRPGFVPAKASYAGSFACVRFEGDMPISLVQDIAKFVEKQFPQFVDSFKRGFTRHMSYHMDGTLINWVTA